MLTGRRSTFDGCKVTALLLVFTLGCNVVENKEENLLMVNILFRHGDRSPVATFPTNPLPASAWSRGFGQLTQLGVKQAFELGTYLHSRYVEGKPFRLLDKFYKPDQVKVRSTDLDRTLMTASSCLAGLYPPSDEELWNRNILWQPIPVHTVPQKQDYLLYPATECPKQIQMYREIMNSEDVQKEIKANKEFYELLTNLTGTQFDSIEKAIYVYDSIKCARYNGFLEPDWVNMTWRNVTIDEKLAELQSLFYNMQFVQAGGFRFRGGPLLGEMIQNMKLMIRNESSEIKSFIYSAHDGTVMAFLASMRAYNDIVPPYASTVMLELLEVDGKHTIRILYRNDSTHDAYELEVKGCGSPCDFETFVSLTKGNIPNDWYSECQVGKSRARSTYGNTLWVVFVVMIVYLVELNTR